jgi:hypothetical protein
VHRAQEVLGVQHADDVLRLAAVERQARVVGVEAEPQDLARGQVGVDHLDAGAVEHDLLDRALMQVERAQKPVAVFLLHHALGMADGQRAHDLLMHREDVCAGLDPHAEQAQHPAHDDAARRHHRAPAPRSPTPTGRAARAAVLLGVVDGVGLGQHLGEDEHQHRHHQRRHGHAALAQKRGEERRGQRRGEDVGQVVAQKDAADQAFIVLLQLSARTAPFAPASPRSAMLRSLPREAAVSAVSEPEKKPEHISRNRITAAVIQVVGSEDPRRARRFRWRC